MPHELCLNKTILLPDWISKFLEESPNSYAAADDRMRFAIELSRQNVIHKTGGPFGAAIFESASGKLVSVGVNIVVQSSASIAHAEIVAMTLAQEALGTFDLGAPNFPAHELITSAQMCSMCFGASCWSGVTRIVYAATRADAEQIAGFDEGPLPTAWEIELAKRGIEIIQSTLRSEAQEVLALYAKSEGTIYNSQRTPLG